MISFSAYTIVPVAGVGLRAVIETDGAFQVSGEFAVLDDLEAHLRKMRPNLLLIEVTSTLDLDRLRRIVSISPATAIILWYDTISPVYLWQAMALGVLGAVCRRSSIETHLECFRTVAGGYTWTGHQGNQTVH
jgi:DNA-binding NarL/FixJ family response regulator